jgi:DNA repair exonuclease SbcCD ATPase subunit
MKLNKLYVKNFKHITEIEINEFKRTTVVIGQNGNGKSSLIQAISFLYTNNLDEKIESFVRWGTDKFEIVAEFSHESDTFVYEVEGSKSCKRKLVINGDDENSFLNSEASKKFAEYIDPVLTEYSAVSQQGKTTELLFQKPAERLRTIKEILKIDNIFTACENIKEDVKKIKEDVDKIEVEQNILNNRIYSFVEEDILKKQVEDDVDVEKLLLKEEQTKAVYEKEQEAVKQYERDILSFNTYTTKINNFKEQISVCENKLSSYDKVLEPEIEFDANQFESLKETLQALKLQQNQYANDIKIYNQSKDNVDRIQKQISDLQTKADAIVLKRLPACKYDDESIKEIQSKLNAVAVNIAREEEKHQLVKQGKCPTCGKDFEEDPKSIEEIITKLQEERTTYYLEQKTIQTEIDAHKKLVEDQKDLSVTKTSLLDKIKFHEEELSKYNGIKEPSVFKDSSINEAEKEISEKEIIKKKADEIKKNNDSINVTIKSTKDKIDFYTSELKSLVIIEKPIVVTITITAFDINYYESLKKRFAVKDQKKQEYQRAVDFNEKLMIEKIADQTKIDANEKKKETLLKEMQIKAEARNFLEKGFSSYLVDKSITFIKEKMNSFFQRTYSKYEVSVEQDKNSVSFFYSNGDIISPVFMSSGAEKAILALSSRVALCSLQKSLDFMIVDEIDSELSASNSQSVFETLLAEKQFNQFFIITHCDSTKEYFENLNDCEIIEIEEGAVV